MEEFKLTINKDKFRSTNAKWNELMLNDPWSVGYVSTLIEAANWKCKEEWEETYYASGKVRNELIDKMASISNYTKEFFNDTTIPHNKSKYYSLSWDIKNINTQKGRTREDLIEKGKILYEAVKNNGYGLTLEECVECVRFRVICETWNGIVIRENNTIGTLQKLFPNLRFEKSEGDIDHTYAVDFQVYSKETNRIVCAIQIKPKSYLGNAPYIIKARTANDKKYTAYKERFGVEVLTIISTNKGEIINTEILTKIKNYE